MTTNPQKTPAIRPITDDEIDSIRQGCLDRIAEKGLADPETDINVGTLACFARIADLRAQLAVAEKDKSRAVRETCPDCAGYGHTSDQDGKEIKCDACNATGLIDFAYVDKINALRSDKEVLKELLDNAANVMSEVCDSECLWQYKDTGKLPDDPTIVSASALAALVIHHNISNPQSCVEWAYNLDDGSLKDMDYCDAQRVREKADVDRYFASIAAQGAKEDGDVH